MIRSLVIAIGFTVALALVWTLVQTIWKKTFKEEYLEEDALSGRRSCANCGCTTACKRRVTGSSRTKKLTE